MVTAPVPRVAFDDVGLLFLKVLALAAMVVDHVDMFLLGGSLGFHDTLGRVVFPLFAFVLAFNLRRVPQERLWALARRMVVVGLIASPAYVLLQGAPLLLNVMFSLGLAVAVGAAWIEGRMVLAVLLFLLGGAVVDYQWFGLLCVLLGWWAFRVGGPGVWVLTLPVGFAGLLLPVNGSWWAALAVVPLWAAWGVEGSAPRWRWLFYGTYPVHLFALAAIALGV